jgi:hypothetical protein
MLWQCIIAGTQEHFEGHTHTQPPPKRYIHKVGGLLPIHLMHWHGVQSLMCGARGPFPPAVAMVVVVVKPVVICAKATEILKNATNTKISCFYSIIFSMTIYCKTY